jgi:hypothetical protein
MVNDCGTLVAAEYVSLPACDAVIVQVPTASIRTDPVVAPPTSEPPVVTEHTDAGDAAKVSSSPDADVVALIANGSAEYARDEVNAPNVIVCVTLEITNVTDVAPDA